MDTSDTFEGTRPEGTTSDARRTADEMRQAARDQAGAFWSDAKRAARSRLGEQKDTAARGIGDFASALRGAARDLDGGRHDTSASMVGTAANGLERMADSLRRKDLDALVRDAEAFAPRQPGMFFAASVAAGFLAVRFLKSSADESNPAAGEDGDARTRSDSPL